MGQTQSYQALEVDDDMEQILEEEEVTRVWDCVMVFEEGSDEVDFVPPVNPRALEYDYLGLLDQEEREKRRARFSLVAADMGGSTRSEKEFFSNERRLVLNALQYKSLLNEEVVSVDLKSTGRKFYYIGIMEPTARQAANDFEYELKLEPEYVITFLNLAGNELAKATFEDEHINEDLWKNLFVKYVDGIPAEVYHTHVMLNPNERGRYTQSLFRIKDRISLIYEMIAQDMEEGGCGIVVERLRYDRCHPLCDFFPIHQAEQLDLIMDDLFSLDVDTWLQLPCDDIRAYFGEYIGIYFAFLEYFTLFLIPLSVIGFVFFAMQLIFQRVLTHGIEWFALCVIIAAIAFPSMWRSKEFEWSTRWGQLRFDFQERARPQFSGDYQRSHIDGRMIEYYPESERATKQAVSLTIVVCFLFALVMSTVGIVALRLWASKVATSMSDYIVSIANALVIIFFNNIYGGFAEMMNTWENYETETAYENNLIVKVFVFRFVNSYASLYYMAFFRKYEKFDDSLSCSAEECMADLTSQLAVIFVTQLFVSNATELGTLYATRLASEGSNAEVFNEETGEVIKEPLEDRVYHEYHSEVYERTFDDYNELLINWGYCTLFVLAFPLAPFFGFISLIVESRIDGYKLCRLVRRPFPRRADDIGAWQGAIEFMTWSIMGTNLFLICFESKALRINPGYKNDGLVMIVTTCIVFFVLSCIWGAIEWHYKQMPPAISEHIERTNHVESVLSRRSQDVREWMNDINNDDLIQWKKWGVEAVLMYISKALCKNEKEHEVIVQIFRYHKIDGEKFAKLTPEQLAAYGIKDSYIATLIVKVRGILKKFAADAKKQAQAIDDLAKEQKENGDSSSASSSLDNAPVFKFLPKHVGELASYLERELKGQAKKKLWDRVDRDGSGLIEEEEMDMFLYFSISVFIKEKFPKAKIPSARDVRLNRKIIGPMKAWLLHFKISPHGLNYDEYERYFPSWLREYYRETLSRGEFGMDVDDFKSPIGSPKSGGGDSKSKRSGNGPSDGYSMPKSTEMATRRPANEGLWIPLLDEVVSFVNALPEKARKTIWSKVAKKAPSVDSSKSLPRLLMILFQLYHKKKQASNFEFHNTDLHQIVLDLTQIIRGYLKDSNLIYYEEFLKNIHRFFQKGVKKFLKDRSR